MFANLRFTIFAVFSLILINCGDSNDTGDNNSTKTITGSISRQVDFSVIPNSGTCLNDNQDPNAAVFVVEGDVSNYSNLTAKDITPTYTSDITKDAMGTYGYTIQFKTSGNFTALLTCNPQSTLEQITFLSREHFFVKLDENGNFDSAVKTATHINSNEECTGCHEIEQNYIISTVDHNNVLGICSDCHMPVAAEFTISINSTLRPIIDNCNTPTGLFSDAAVYLAEGNLTRIDLLTVDGISIVDIYSLSENITGQYEYTASFPTSGHYMGLLSCNASAQELDISFILANHFIVLYQDMASVNSSELPAVHLNTSNNCQACHTFGQDNLVSIFDHRETLAPCVECHDG